jgi:hypothetical protein
MHRLARSVSHVPAATFQVQTIPQTSAAQGTNQINGSFTGYDAGPSERIEIERDGRHAGAVGNSTQARACAAADGDGDTSGSSPALSNVCSHPTTQPTDRSVEPSSIPLLLARPQMLGRHPAALWSSPAASFTTLMPPARLRHAQIEVRRAPRPCAPIGGHQLGPAVIGAFGTHLVRIFGAHSGGLGWGAAGESTPPRDGSLPPQTHRRSAIARSYCDRLV